MAASEMTPTQMTLTLGPLSTVCSPGDAPRPTVLDADGSATAPVAGPALFRFPIVLPKTATGVSCRAVLRVPFDAAVLVGNAPAAHVRGGRSEVALGEEAFIAPGAGSDFAIPELPFADFRCFELGVRIEAPGNAHARLAFEAEVSFLLPVESASDYLNYVMTQA